MLHELWLDGDEGLTSCLAGPMGRGARGSLGPFARLEWTVEAPTQLDAIALYYEHMGWGRFPADQG